MAAAVAVAAVMPLGAGCGGEVEPPAGGALGVEFGAADRRRPLSGDPVSVRVRDVMIIAEVADSDEERRQGLMLRTHLPPGRGMIFDFGGETTSGFYMFRTLLPLSIMFVRDGRVVGVQEMAPCSEDDPAACPVYYPDGAYTHAVEAPARSFAGVVAGDPVAIGSD